MVESLVTDKAAEAGDDAVGKLDENERKRIIKRMRMMIWGGALTGLLIALCIGGAFIAVVSLLVSLTLPSARLTLKVRF